MQTPRSSSAYSIFHKVLEMPVYRRCREHCWRLDSFTWQTAVMVEMLKLQRDNQIPSPVTTEDMLDLLVVNSWMTLSSRLWRSEVESFDDPAMVSTLNMLWDVNVYLKMRDVEFVARTHLDSPENIPPEYRRPMAAGVAKKYAAILTKQQRQRSHHAPKLLTPQEMALQVVPRVFQSIWGPSPTPRLGTPPHDLDMLAVCMTKAVEGQLVQGLPSPPPYVFMTRPKRNRLVRSIVEEVMRQSYAPQTGWLNDKLVLAIPTVATRQIQGLF